MSRYTPVLLTVSFNLSPPKKSSPSGSKSGLWDRCCGRMELKSSAALAVLKQIVDRTIKQISHLDEFALRNMSVGHPVINRFSGYSQLLRKSFHGKPKAAPFSVDVWIGHSAASFHVLGTQTEYCAIIIYPK